MKFNSTKMRAGLDIKLNEPYATYLAMGRTNQLNKQQVEQIKKQNAGSPVSVEKINVNGNKGE